MITPEISLNQTEKAHVNHFLNLHGKGPVKEFLNAEGCHTVLLLDEALENDFLAIIPDQDIAEVLKKTQFMPRKGFLDLCLSHYKCSLNGLVCAHLVEIFGATYYDHLVSILSQINGAQFFYLHYLIDMKYMECTNRIKKTYGKGTFKEYQTLSSTNSAKILETIMDYCYVEKNKNIPHVSNTPYSVVYSRCAEVMAYRNTLLPNQRIKGWFSGN